MQGTAPAVRFVEERLGIDLKSVDVATELTALGLDSLAMLELMFEIEEKFGVTVEQGIAPPRNCGELLALIERIAPVKS